MLPRIFIDGSVGTTGLKIRERLSERRDVEIITLPEEKRKDATARAQAINGADYVFLCLPDDAARTAVSLCENPDTVVIDASTAHRTDPDWAYGFPELSQGHRDKILESKRIAVPGCYASAFAALVYPLAVPFGLRQYPFSAHAVSGYSGGGKSAIAEYEDGDRDAFYDAPRAYALDQNHKHLKEMKSVCGLEYAPAFMPMICGYYAGILLQVPLARGSLPPILTQEGDRLANFLYEHYRYHYENSKNVKVQNGDGLKYLSACSLAGTDKLHIYVTSDAGSERIILSAVLDNLGKGACGAALQCLDMKLGLI